MIQLHLPVQLPCYDFTPLTKHTLGTPLLAVKVITLGILSVGGGTGGVYKAQEHIHRGMLTHDY